MEPPKRELLFVGPRGLIQLPEWAWKRLHKMSRRRSKKKRHVKKAVKKEFMKVLIESLREANKWPKLPK